MSALIKYRAIKSTSDFEGSQGLLFNTPPSCEVYFAIIIVILIKFWTWNNWFFLVFLVRKYSFQVNLYFKVSSVCRKLFRKTFIENLQCFYFITFVMSFLKSLLSLILRFSGLNSSHFWKCSLLSFRLSLILVSWVILVRMFSANLIAFERWAFWK